MTEPGLTTLLLVAAADSLLLEHMLGATAVLSLGRRYPPALVFATLVALVLPPVLLLLWTADGQLQGLGLASLRLPVWVMLLAILVSAGMQLVTRCFPRHADVWHPLLKLLLLNSLILGAALLLGQQDYGFAAVVTAALGLGLGLAITVVVFAALCERLEACEAPAALQGLPLRVLSLGLMALAMHGFGSGVLQ